MTIEELRELCLEEDCRSFSSPYERVYYVIYADIRLFALTYEQFHTMDRELCLDLIRSNKVRVMPKVIENWW